jgi:NADPH-dependent ferric siderophore reductase
MARTNAHATRVKPAETHLVTLQVLRREQISPSFARVTFGGGDIDRFEPLGYDQWFRLFLPVSQNSLSRLPNKLDTLAYLRFLAIAKTDRPVLRNYTVRAFRDDGANGAELDVDFVLHGSPEDGTSGPAAGWAQSCAPGDAVALIDEGRMFNAPDGGESSVALVADETGLPAVAGILAALPRDARGSAVVEIAHPDDAQAVDAPAGVDVHWVVRADPHAVPGAAALETATALDAPAEAGYAWVAGEQTLAAAMRRHWVRAGVAKSAISFCGYWKAARH